MVYTSLNEAFPDFRQTKKSYPVGYESNGSLQRVRTPVKPQNTVHYMNQVIHKDQASYPEVGGIDGYDPSSINLNSSTSAPVHFDIYNQNHIGSSRSNMNSPGMNFSLDTVLANKLKSDTNAVTCQGCFSHLNSCKSCRTNALQILNGNSNSISNQISVEGFNGNSNGNLSGNEVQLKKKVERLEKVIEFALFIGIGFAIAKISS